ncbi:L,D-transpeptidase family protein [Actibacterium pelagium]
MNGYLAVTRFQSFKFAGLAGAVAIALSLGGSPALAEVTPFKQAVAQAAYQDDVIAAFYKERGYKPLWTSNADRGRRKAFLKAAEEARAHGLPGGRYDPEQIEALFRSAKSGTSRGKAEVELTKMFLRYARDVQSGILIPERVVDGIERKAPRRRSSDILNAFAKSSPAPFVKSLAPQGAQYARLMEEKLRLERILGSKGWGPKVRTSRKIEPGDSGKDVVGVRNRLIAMGYLKRTASQTYDANMVKAMKAFQQDHGLFADGVIGKGTLKELNHEPQYRLQQVVVAMERERWMNRDLGRRHVLVNIPDFHARIVENGKVAFQTRSVVGMNLTDRRTPEFSDVMNHMVINPTWNVPRSIATKEYLPMLQENPNAVSHLNLLDASGRRVSREGLDFTQFNEKNFPFDMKQPPSNSNALGLVKFMFPNPHNIYLHDTPHKSLFGRQTRAFSHGCIRLRDPFDFAYALLSKQTNDPQGFFKARLSTGKETRVDLKDPLQVHLIYRTAYTNAKGRTQFRDDIYGRDAAIFKALSQAGVVLYAVQS